MRFLPQANPLYQNIPTSKVVLPDILEKLGKGGFTGYLSHTCQNFEAYCIFAKGKLICAISTDGDREKSGFEAVVMMFDKCVGCSGEINVFRMTADLAVCAHALVVGKKRFNGDEVRQIDIKAMLALLKNEEINGVVRFYTEKRYAMMFYRSGIPIGFYHDGASNIESSPDESRRVAALPGARVDVSITQTLDELLRYDLLQMVNLQKLWESAHSRHPRQTDKTPGTAHSLTPTTTISPEKLSELLDDLKEIAMAYLSRPGGQLVESILQKLGGVAALANSETCSQFLSETGKGSLKLDPDAKIEEMVDLMQSEIAGRLAV